MILVEQEKRLGGVCLIRGCIPSKALLHAAKLITEARHSEHMGIQFGEPKLDLDKLRAWKNSIVDKLAGGVSTLAKQRGVEVLQGRGYFEDSKTLRVETAEGQKFVTYDAAIVAVGSKSAMPKAFDLGNPRIMTSRRGAGRPGRARHAADRRRRLHRDGIGNGVRDAGQQGRGRRSARARF